MPLPIKFIIPNWPAPSQIKAFTCLRQAEGRNILHPTNQEYELALIKSLGLPSQPIWLKQVHGTTLVEALTDHINYTADASFSKQPHQVCAILTADCLPILLCHSRGSIVAAIHAGWRGLALGIIENVVQSLQQPLEEWLVWLGPAISVKHFEVGSDVYQTFIRSDADLKSAFTICGTDKWFADIYHIARIKLTKLGIKHIYGGDYCTYSQKALFYSYRRDKQQIGRMTSLIWIDKVFS